MKCINIIKILFLLIIITKITACKKAEDVPTIIAINTITDKIVADSNYKLLKQAIFKAGLDFKFKTTGAYSLFAPDDSAFLNTGLTPAIIKDSIAASTLSSLILYHTISPKILSTNIAADSLTKIASLNSDSIFVYKSIAGAIFVNGIPVTLANKEADNGVIHKLSKVLKPASGSIFATIASTAAGLDSLLVAISRVNSTANALGGDTTFTATLSNSKLTLFAPNNAAFRDLLTALSYQRINQIPVIRLKEILKYHLVTDRIFSPQLKNGNLTMFSDIANTTVVDITSAPTIKGKNLQMLAINGTTNNTSNITTSNIICRNGVVHLIDRVLLP